MNINTLKARRASGMISSERLEGRTAVPSGERGKGQNRSRVREPEHSLSKWVGPKQGEKQRLRQRVELNLPHQ